jgi:hypothetical protein
MLFIEGGEARWKELREINDTNFYGKAIADYVERWAELMEEKIVGNCNGVFPFLKGDIKVVVEDTSHKADTEGITGAQYGIAVQVMGEVWLYGDALRRWHNGEFGVSDEQADGRTVNPALLTIDSSTE